MSIENVIAGLEAFVPTEEDDDTCKLYEILAGLQPLAPELRKPVIPAILSLIERYPEAELGSPGTLVHELESIPGYQPFLRESVLRQPTDLSTWMVNRILNSELPQDIRAGWLSVLSEVTKHPLASKILRRTATHFLQRQAER
ncbi:hypothetical protein [Herbaspirillum sp. B65]|uniref:hypothetical protein n=1 Tax=Herbaspirillum sp. B65 TaxID=137708 RepID=UPI0011D266C4|nr:hypothetical protein [Herbaspirillum sp. B65]